MSAPAAAKQIGYASLAINDVRGSAKGSRKINTNSPVFRGETIRTGSGSQATVILRDATRLQLGANARLRLNRFVSGSRSNVARRIGISILRGATRFGTGHSRKSAYRLRTPVATMGIRGTTLDIYVGRRGETGVLLISGAVRVCARGGKCRTLRSKCSFVRIKSNGRMSYRARLGSRQAMSGISNVGAFPKASVCLMGSFRDQVLHRSTGGDGPSSRPGPSPAPAPSPAPDPEGEGGEGEGGDGPGPE